jgi:raffinose/stachyose/melibiose transport system substrate-binding protein
MEALKKPAPEPLILETCMSWTLFRSNAGGKGNLPPSLCLFLALLLFFSCGGEKQTVVLDYIENDSLKNADFAGAVDEISAEFMKQNPGIAIKRQSYPDAEIANRLKLLKASNNFPDVIKYWSTPEYLDEYVARGDFLELDIDQYRGNGYIAGALESNMRDGKLFGVPDTCDIYVIYYNQGIFERSGVPLPATFDDLFRAADAFKAKGIIPAVTSINDGWAVTMLLDAIVGRIDKDFQTLADVRSGAVAYPASSYARAAALLDRLVKKGFFPGNVLAIDYFGARDLFGNQKAAMYLMGSWELGLARDERFTPEFRKNLRAMKLPAVVPGQGSADNTVGWFGGNHVISSKTTHKKAALQFLDFISRNRARILWASEQTIPAQYVKPQPGDHPVAVDLLRIVADTKKLSGSALVGRAGLDFRAKYSDLCVRLVAQTISPEDFSVRTEALLKEVR